MRMSGGLLMKKEELDSLFAKIEGEYPVFEHDTEQFRAMRQNRIRRWVEETTADLIAEQANEKVVEVASGPATAHALPQPGTGTPSPGLTTP
jgi:hypothetical protein